MYVHLDSTIIQLFITMYILFLVFTNFTKQDTKKYTLMSEFNYILYYWAPPMMYMYRKFLCYVYCEQMFSCNIQNLDWAWHVQCHICDWMDWMEE